jgi:hypothetical protein
MSLFDVMDQFRHEDLWGSSSDDGPVDMWADRHMPEARHTSDFGLLGHARTEDKISAVAEPWADRLPPPPGGTVESKGGGM